MLHERAGSSVDKQARPKPRKTLVGRYQHFCLRSLVPPFDAARVMADAGNAQQSARSSSPSEDTNSAKNKGPVSAVRAPAEYSMVTVQYSPYLSLTYRPSGLHRVRSPDPTR